MNSNTSFIVLKSTPRRGSFFVVLMAVLIPSISGCNPATVRIGKEILAKASRKAASSADDVAKLRPTRSSSKALPAGSYQAALRLLQVQYQETRSNHDAEVRLFAEKRSKMHPDDVRMMDERHRVNGPIIKDKLPTLFDGSATLPEPELKVVSTFMDDHEETTIEVQRILSKI